jgi:hypothetical protein
LGSSNPHFHFIDPLNISPHDSKKTKPTHLHLGPSILAHARSKNKNIQQRVFASGHPPNY